MRELLRSLSPTGLRGRLLATVLLAVVPLVGLLFLYAGIENRAAQERAVTDIRGRLESDIRAMDDLVAADSATLSTFGITHAIQARDWGLTQENTTRLQAQHPDYAAIVVVDASGRVRADSVSGGHPLDASREPVFGAAVRARGLVVTGYVRDALTGRPAIEVGLPVYGAKGALICVEYIAFDPVQFRARMSAGGAGSSVEEILDGAGTLILRRPVIAGTEGKRLAASGLREAVLARREGETTAVGIDGVTRQYFFAPVVSPPQGTLYLAVSFSADQFLSAERRAFELTLGGFGLVALLALGLAWVVGTISVYRPAKVLAAAAERMSAGELTTRAELAERNDELGVVAREFNAMADAVERQIKELEGTRNELRLLNAELEERVRRRTAELEASNKELEAFSYSVSHDLRSPLRAIDGFSQALLEDYADKLDADGRDDLNRVRDAATRMGDLIDSLLKLSRLSRQEMRVQDVDLSAVAAETAETLRKVDPGRDVVFDIAPGVRATGDPALLRNVLENLMGNAWKFTGKHAHARIGFGSTRADGEQAYFVRDDGSGFDMAYADKLFGAFQRLHGQSEFPGIGIGLATTARIVHRHGGRIWAEGEPEKGATFYFTLQ